MEEEQDSILDREEGDENNEKEEKEHTEDEAEAEENKEIYDENSMLNFLVATDLHLGFAERDFIRKNDSFNTFEEILATAKQNKVDFVLLGGDLFHVNNPSKETLHRTIEIFRKYCCGDDPIPLEIIKSNQEESGANFEDPNFNISLPVFTIHGNHDDPVGTSGLSALDILSASKLVNYFGKTTSNDSFELKPILIRKGETKICLHGLGHVKDERLFRILQQKKGKFLHPSGDDWFNLFVLHQNRNQHAKKNGNISESLLRFPQAPFDLVVWGHEHLQKIMPTESAQGCFKVSQPGSSVAVSIIPDEEVEKKIAIFSVYKKKLVKTTPISLKTVRPITFNSISLSNIKSKELQEDKKNPEKIAEVLKKEVEILIEKVKQRQEERIPDFYDIEKHPEWKYLHLPLIRLKVDHSGGFDSILPQKFAQKFIGKIANPSELLLFTRKKQTEKKKVLEGGVELELGDDEADELDLTTTTNPEISIADSIRNSLKTSHQPQLHLLNSGKIFDETLNFVDEKNKFALEESIEAQEQTMIKRLWKKMHHWLEPKQSGASSSKMKDDDEEEEDEDMDDKVSGDLPRIMTESAPDKEIQDLMAQIAQETHKRREESEQQRKDSKIKKLLGDDQAQNPEEEESPKKGKKKLTKKSAVKEEAKKASYSSSDTSDAEDMPNLAIDIELRDSKGNVIKSDDEAAEDAEEGSSTTKRGSGRGRGRGRGASASTRGRGRGRGRGKKAATSSRVKKEDSDEDEEFKEGEEEKIEEENEEEEEADKKGKKKKAASTRKRKTKRDEDDSESEKKKRKTSAATAKPILIDEEEEQDDEEEEEKGKKKSNKKQLF